VDAWPVLRYWNNAENREAGAEAFWPFIAWESSPKESHFVLRPFFSRRHDKESNVTESYFPWPLGAGTRRPDLSRSWLFPLFLRDREAYPDGTMQRRLALLPILYWRSGRGKPLDLLIFPLGGRLHNLARQRKIILVLWPLFIYQEADKVKSWSVLYPIFKYIRWDGGGRGFKFWPLFGWNVRPGKLRKYFILWPIFQREWRKLDQGESSRWFIFPFYGRIDDPKGKARTIGWPFFGMRRDDNLQQEDWWYPWPLLGHRTGKGVSARRFWPLCSWETVNKESGKEEKAIAIYRKYVNFLWPLGWYSRARLQLRTGAGTADDTSEKMSFRIVPLCLREWERTASGRSGVWQLWPLIKHRYMEDGEAHLEMPSILPLRYWAGFEDHFGPFFRVFEFHRTAEGQRSWRLLWRILRVDTGPKDRYLELWPIFSVHGRTGAVRESRWEVLKGLAGRTRVGAQRQWRLLYVIRIGSLEAAE